MNTKLIIIASFLIIALGAYWFYLDYKGEPLFTFPQRGGSKISEQSRIDISLWKTYRNEKYGFEVKYPNDWKVLTGMQSGKACELSLGESVFILAAHADVCEFNYRETDGIAIMPRGGFDITPITSPKIFEGHLGNKVTIEKQWRLTDGQVLQIRLKNPPDQWLNGNGLVGGGGFDVWMSDGTEAVIKEILENISFLK